MPEKPEKLDTPLKQKPQRLLLINAILSANRELPTLLDQKKLAAANINEYAMHNDLLVHQNQLMVPNENILRTRLCDEFHRPAHRAHPGRGMLDSKGYHNPVITIGCLHVRTVWGCESIMN
jgi:hypothetical protein